MFEPTPVPVTDGGSDADVDHALGVLTSWAA